MFATIVLSLLASHTSVGQGGGLVLTPPPADESAFRAVANGAGYDLVPVTIAGATVTVGAPVVTGIQFLAIDFTGHSSADTFAAGEPRVISLTAGATALELPDPDATLLIHFKRTGVAQFGFVALSSRSGARVLLELGGTGPSGTKDPFDPRVGVSEDGERVVLVAPGFSQGQGGVKKCWLARIGGPSLAGGQDLVDLAPGGIDLDGESPTFAAGALFAVASDRLFRATADGSAPFVQVTLPPSGSATNPDVFAELARSADRSTLVVLAGASELLADLYVVTAGTAPFNRTQAPQAIRSPGYLPDAIDGPFLTLADDGSAATYIVEFPTSNEMFSIDLAPGSGAPVQVTTDANFEHSIDAMSGMHTGGLKTSFLAAGGNTGADLYSVTPLGGGNLVLTNMTQSSGDATPSFSNTATLQPQAAPALGGRRLVVDDRTAAGQGFAVLDVAASGVVTTPFTNLVTPPTIIGAGPNASVWGVLATSSAGTALARARGGKPLQILIAAPSSVTLDHLAIDKAGATAALRAVLAPGVEFPIVVPFATGVPHVVGSAAQSGVRDVKFTRQGRLTWTASIGAGAVATFVSPPPFTTATPVGAATSDAFWVK